MIVTRMTTTLRRRRLGLLVAIVVVVTGAVIGAVRLASPRGPYRQHLGLVLVRSDDRTVVVIGTNPPNGCGGKPVLEAVERRGSVGLTLEAPTSSICDLTVSQIPVTYRLAQPLGSRRLVDSTTGHVAQVVDESALPTPTALPPGFRLAEAAPEAGLVPLPSGAKAVSRTYQPVDLDVVSALTLTIVFTPQSAAPNNTSYAGTVLLHGHRQAEVRTGSPTSDTAESISWTEDGMSIVVTSDRTALGTPSTDSNLLPFAGAVS